MIGENIISDIGKILVFILTILSIYLVSAKKQRKLPHYLFAAFLITTAIDMTGYFLGPTRILVIDSLKFGSVLLQMPLFFLYVRSACYFNFELKTKHFLHALPFFAFVIVFLITRLSDLSTNLFDIASSVQYYAYVTAVIYTLITFKRQYKANYSSNHEMTYKWLMRTTILFLIGNLLVVVRGFIGMDNPALFYVNIITSCFALIVICWFVLSGLHHPNLFAGIDQHVSYSNNTHLEKVQDEELEKLIRYMETEKPYLDDKITLQSLATDYSIPEKQLSSLINQNLGKHFFDFINSYRIKDAQRLLTEQHNLTVLEILFDVGFNSKSSFYTAFKKETGTTPSNYRKSNS